MQPVNHSPRAQVDAASSHYASDAPDTRSPTPPSDDGMWPALSEELVGDLVGEMMAEFDKHLAAVDEHAAGGPHDPGAAALPSQAGAVAASAAPSASLQETVITIEADAPLHIAGSPPVEKSGYAERQQNLSNVADTIKKAVQLIASLATTGSNAAVNLTPGLANAGWETAAFSQAVVLSGNLITQCLHAWSDKPLPQQANFIANLASAPVARYMNRPQNDEAVIRACQRISLIVNATLSLLAAGANLGLPGVAAKSPKLAAAICALATGIMTIVSDITQYESDKMKRKAEQKDAAASPSVAIDIDGPAPERRASV
ncbi:hypothetical protein OB934_22425 [Aeromonas salmonicida]|uniref:hypothetical protein n=1 Tax=Aeromonas salmonicida TaxID=645 RepID=UPI00259E92E8|nr:hypothetical protein [Aeromonas salmonicida]MDM5065514.1 hypothetical protein [Aeromonas salmonicida]